MIIFIDNVEKSRTLLIYLQILLPDKLKNRGKDTIKSFLSILETISKTDWLEKLLTYDIKLIIYIDAIGIGVDIPDIQHII